MKDKVSIFWFRRDLRLEDNAGLHHALASENPVMPIFVFDTDILNQLENKYDRRVDYIHQNLNQINKELKKYNSGLKTFYGKPLEVFKKLSETYQIESVYCNRDYEPQAIKRDNDIKDFFKTKAIDFLDFKDQVIFEKSDIVKADQTPYTVYTPYSKKWKSALQKENYTFFKMDFKNFINIQNTEIHRLKEIGFESTDMKFQTPNLDSKIIDNYDKYRDFPTLNHTTHLGIALRFGTISIRKCVEFALKHNEIWLNELIWREFFMQILYHFPKVVNQSFKPKYDLIQWRNDESEFQLWCDGKTGYPVVDAGMLELNKTGFMHNRVRMITASFLCKHLLIDWRWGEAYFAQKLNDYDLSANNGNWQWAAGSGCDAVPYFRVFNPTTQTLKFDKELKYVRKWNPDFESLTNIPIVEHSFARERALATYKKALNEEI